MSTIPTPWVVQVRRWTQGVPDSHGNVTEGLGDPEPWAVHAIAPGAMIEPNAPDRDASHVLWSVYGPAGTGPLDERDAVIVDGVQYPVSGRPRPYDRGPWPFTDGGVVVELRRVDG